MLTSKPERESQFHTRCSPKSPTIFEWRVDLLIGIPAFETNYKMIQRRAKAVVSEERAGPPF
jgi:hypothetical protein